MTQDHLEEDRKAACKWAYNLLHQRTDWCVLDTETTSLDGIAVEIAAIAPDGTILFNSLVNPSGEPIHPKARAAHKITDEELASAPFLPEVWAQLQEALAPYKTIITYNAVFDQSILRRHAQRYKLPVLTHSWECAMERYAEYYGDWNDWHESYRWQPLNGGHRALADAQAALKRIHEMASYHVPEVKAQHTLRFSSAAQELLRLVLGSAQPEVDADTFLASFAVRVVESYDPHTESPYQILDRIMAPTKVMGAFDGEEE